MILDARTSGRLRGVYEAARRFAADGLALFGALAIFALYVAPVFLHPNILVPIPNVLIFGVALIVGGLAFVGPLALRRTPMDLLFAFWLILAIASHVYATTLLDRQLLPDVLYTYLVFILSVAVSFRAGFAIVKISPAFGPIALLMGLIFVLFCSAFLGILQSVGPVKQQAVNFATNLGASSAKILEGASNGRSTGVFGGPNIQGYANVVGSMCTIAVGIALARVSRPWHVLLVMAVLGVFGYSTLLCQSRTSIALFCVAVMVYGLALRRLGSSRASLATYIVLCLAVGGGGMIVFQTSKLTYVESTFQTDITKDESIIFRQRAILMAANIAGDIAPLGRAEGQVNQTDTESARGYDRYWTFGVDNEWINIYLTHGVLGPVLIALFYFLGFRASLRAQKSLHTPTRMIGLAATLSLALALFFSISGVRVAKYETAIFLSVILGGAFAAIDLPGAPVRRLRPGGTPPARTVGAEGA